MKNYEEMAETVFRRIEEYKQTQRKRRRAIYTTAASLTCAALVAVMGFTAWKMSNTEPSVSLDGGGANTTEHTPKNPVILQNPTEDISTPTESTTDSYSEPPAIGGTSFCPIHETYYHSFPSNWIDHVGEERFHEWLEATDSATVEAPIRDGLSVMGECYTEQTVYDFIHHFGYPTREVFEEEYYSWYYTGQIHDLDILFGDDENAADEFYKSSDERNETESKRYKFERIKRLVQNQYGPEFIEAYGSLQHFQIEVSLYDMVTTFDISYEELLEIADVVPHEWPHAYYWYNFECMYAEDAEEVFEKLRQDPHPVQAMDAVICRKSDYETQ